MAAQGDSCYPYYLNNLRYSLQVKYEQLKETADINETIYLYQKSIELACLRHLYLPGCLSNLRIALYLYFEQGLELNYLSDLQSAFELWSEATSITTVHVG